MPIDYRNDLADLFDEVLSRLWSVGSIAEEKTEVSVVECLQSGDSIGHSGAILIQLSLHALSVFF